MQDQGDSPRPIAFMSRALKPTEQRYSAYERELAAIAYCFIQWRHYLEGCPGGVTVITDHQPLTHLMEQQVLSRLQSRWLRHGLFQSIQPKMQYQPGKANIVADALSRGRPSVKSEESAQQEQQNDEDAGVQNDQAFTVTSFVRLDESELSAFRDAQQADPVLKTLCELPKMELQRRNFEISPQGILVKVKDEQQRPVVPKEMRQKILQENHDAPTVGHVGIQRTVDLVKRTYWWRG